MAFINRELFTDKYQRNNKQTGVKNLRCFPTCAAEGHQPTGFCGRKVKIQMEPATHLILAEFTQITLPVLFPPHARLSLEDVQRHRGLMVGKPVLQPGESDYDWTVDVLPDIVRTTCQQIAEGKDFSVLEFRVRRGWHYDWVSNRHTCMNLHCMRTYMFAIIDEGRALRCIKVLDSPPFQVYSRRRSLKTLKDTHMQSASQLTESRMQKRESAETADSSEMNDESDDEDSEEKMDDIMVTSQLTAPKPASRLRSAMSSSSTSSYVSLPQSTSPLGYLPQGVLHFQPGPSRSPYVYSAQVQEQQQMNTSILTELLESLERNEMNQLRIDLRVSPLVFAGAIRCLLPHTYDQRHLDTLLTTKLTRPAPAARRTFCQSLAVFFANSPQLCGPLARSILDAHNDFELVNGFVSIAFTALSEYARMTGSSLEGVLNYFRHEAQPPSSIFSPLSPYSYSHFNG